MKRFLIIILILFTFFTAFTQENDLKEKAFIEFKNENYPEAIKLLKTALNENPDDFELYYYLGYFTHYNAYDSRPLAGYNISYSDTVFYFLDKALELNPTYGNATYFYVAECGADAMYTLQNKDYETVKSFYRKAANKGGFPNWAIEYGKLLLSQLEKNAIFFTLGDFTLNVCWYLQLCESFRTDISVIPMSHLNRPWFAIELKDGALFEKVKLNISTNQLLDLHPYKWDTTIIRFPIAQKVLDYYNLPPDYSMIWKLEPDLSSNRTFLSARRALLLSIVETNEWERPIYFAKGIDEFWTAGLNSYFQNFGLVDKLLPFETSGTNWELDKNALDKFVFSESLSNYKDMILTNQPRVSGLVSAVYCTAYLTLASYYKELDQMDKIEMIISNFESKIEIGVLDEYENYYYEKLKELRN